MSNVCERQDTVTVPQLRVWSAVCAVNEEGLGATFREVATACGWPHVSNVSQHLARLKRKGYVDWRPQSSRTVVTTRRPSYVQRTSTCKPVEIPAHISSISEADAWLESQQLYSYAVRS